MEAVTYSPRKKVKKRGNKPDPKFRKDKEKKSNSGPSKSGNLVPSLSLRTMQGLLSTQAVNKVQESGLNILSLSQIVTLPPAGRFKHCRKAWKIITDDQLVLDIIIEG